ncbi:MAG: sigma-E factor negative regulatory protein [Xanthomonadales bacterium]|nr:sigma-E factor negative regulatory protein [Xanthomonadales bacterium]MDH3925315.1 sigma-E factor negative regulatory protein [Xanthomonadales bacterium]MDH3941341.1 sigma-E factor negative regulatory protein [Xanthomonadales bacterium]MDH3999949.1 sigma-E factor negative regulatory protein [Xanthomonadales bacterium]
MSKETREHLSALVDGEITADTSRFLVRRLGSDSELRATWTRYHLVRDCLRHQDGAVAGDDLCARISKAIENEQPEPHRKGISTRWLKPASGLAIAASVALMAITSVGPVGPGASLSSGDVAAGSPVQQFTSPQSLTPAPASSQVSFSGGRSNNDRNIDKYLLRHYQASGATGGKGFVTYVPIVITGSKLSDGSERINRDAEPDSAEDEESGSK